MRQPRPLWPLTFRRLYHRHHYPPPPETMSERSNMSQNKSKKPPLTHFLCLPLTTPVSLPQLESSLALFKSSIASLPVDPYQSRHALHQRPLIPHDAVRPLGTLHLTLGVMSLPTPERLNEALEFFHSLDLAALMREAENTTHSAQLNTEAKEKREPTPNPLTISLESLYALPRARSATVLYAAPVDPTSRLYPFCKILREQFVQAGFVQMDYQKESRKKDTKPLPQGGQNNPSSEPQTDQLNLPENIPAENAERAGAPQTPALDQLEPRPLLLHATVVNTVYARGKNRHSGGHGRHHKNKNLHRNDRHTFDARDVLYHFRDFYLDSERVTPRSSVIAITESDTAHGNGSDDSLDGEDHPEAQDSLALTREGRGRGDGSASGEQEVDLSSQLLSYKIEKSTKYPFVWARDFPLEAICICEMGARKLDPYADESGMNARLGEKYPVVAERSLDFQLGKIPG